MDMYVINLRERTDRWDNIKKEFANIKSVNLVKYNAIRHNIGFIGCALSHINIIKMAKSKKLPFVIIMEDDTKIVNNNFEYYFNKIIEYLKNNNNWNIFNGNPSCCSEKPNQKIKYVNANPEIIFYEFGYTTNFIIFSERIYDKIISLEKMYYSATSNEAKQKAFDVILLGINDKITHLPYLTSQYYNKSDIMGVSIDYDRFILDGGMKFINKKLNKIL